MHIYGTCQPRPKNLSGSTDLGYKLALKEGRTTLPPWMKPLSNTAVGCEEDLAGRPTSMDYLASSPTEDAGGGAMGVAAAGEPPTKRGEWSD